MLTFLPLDRIQSLEAAMQQSDYQPNTAQRLLAEEVIGFVHGDEGVSAALTATQVTHQPSVHGEVGGLAALSVSVSKAVKVWLA